jgi:putative DNA-invertase from lambdoid prophage Rac
MTKRATKRAAFYLRVSTEEQTTANQLPGLEQMARQRGLELVTVYQEKESAAADRPEFARMMKDAHRGEFDTLIIWAVDRFGRSMAGNVQDVLALDRRGVNVISYSETWLELAGPMRGVILAFMSWVAESERTRLIERTKAGQARARAEGKQIGRPRKPVNVKIARSMLAGGAKRRSVALALGVSIASLERALKSGGSGDGAQVIGITSAGSKRQK